MTIKDLEDFFDENIPQEVLDSDGWDTKLLPNLETLNDLNYSYDDITENFDYDN